MTSAHFFGAKRGKIPRYVIFKTSFQNFLAYNVSNHQVRTYIYYKQHLDVNITAHIQHSAFLKTIMYNYNEFFVNNRVNNEINLLKKEHITNIWQKNWKKKENVLKHFFITHLRSIMNEKLSSPSASFNNFFTNLQDKPRANRPNMLRQCWDGLTWMLRALPTCCPSRQHVGEAANIIEHVQ